MTKLHFSFKEVFQFGWAKTKLHAWFMFLTLIIILIIVGATKTMPIVNGIISMMLAVSLASISLKISNDQPFTFHDLLTPILSYKKVLKIFALTIVVAIPVVISLSAFMLVPVGAMVGSRTTTIIGFILGLLLLVPTVYLTVRLKFFPYVVIENENDSLKTLLTKSYKLTEHNFTTMFIFLILMSILNIIGLMIFFVGLFVTIPISLFSSAYLYNRLKAHTV